MAISPKKVTLTENTKEAKELNSQFSSPPPIDLKMRASQINRTMLKVDLNQDRLQKLRKEALRGECREVPEAKLINKPKRTSDLLTQILKSEHKTNNSGTQIIKLPKLPFGKHTSYNEDSSFKDRHFFEENHLNSNPDKLKELEEITRKFRLHEKKYKANKKLRLQTAKPMLSDLTCYNVYDMGPGVLVCDIEEGVINSYEEEKNKFVHIVKGKFSNTFKELDDDSPEKKFFIRKTINGRDEKKLVSRLQPVREFKDTNLSQFYSSKYSSLFEPPESETEDFKLKVRRSSMN